MKHLIYCTTIALMVGCLGSCGDDSATEGGDHTWHVSYRASNETSNNLIIGLSGPAVAGATSVETRVSAGATTELLSYDTFLGSSPEVSDDFWCVSIWLESDRSLVGQLCPVSSDQWELGNLDRYQTDFRLIVTEGDLEPIEDQCPRLAGVVFESETGQAIAGAMVAYNGENDFFLPTDSSGRYLFYLPGGPIQGLLTVSGEGYHSVEHTLPGDVVGFSNGLYRLDFGLMMNGE